MSKRMFVLIMILIMNLFCLVADSSYGSNRVPGSFRVTFIKGTTDSDVQDFIKRFSHFEVKESAKINHGFRYYSFNEKLVDDLEAFINSIRKDKIIETVGFSIRIPIDDEYDPNPDIIIPR